jgi:hypothetical protein
MSACRHVTAQKALTGFSWNFISGLLLKLLEIFQ